MEQQEVITRLVEYTEEDRERDEVILQAYLLASVLAGMAFLVAVGVLIGFGIFHG